MSREEDHFFTILGHLDTFGALRHQRRSFGIESTTGVCDYPRMWRNNLRVGLFAVFPCFSQYNIISGLDEWFAIVDNPQNHLIHIKNLEDFDTVRQSDKIGAILHTEGSGGFDSEFKFLRLAAKLGLRSLGITWANENRFGTGYLFRGDQRDRGLSAEGKELIQEAQSLGITIDVSHLNDRSFWDALEITSKPLLATHSNARSVCDIGRNLTDEQIKAIQGNHGVIGLNWGHIFLDPKVKANEVQHARKDFGLEVLKQHLDHIVSVADIHTIGIGSDFDGTSLPDCIDSCDKMTVLYEYLMENGYSRADLRKITFENLHRVFRNTW